MLVIGHETMDAAAYYRDLTDAYLGYGRESFGWHYGIWEPDVRSHHEALVRSNMLLVRGLDVNARTRILDVGCGCGGFAVWAAENYGCEVTGITVCRPHIELARQLASKRGIAKNCRFLAMNMNEMDFPNGSFDLVVNQDTLCYAIDKKSYLAKVHRLLQPGGYWRAVAFSIREGPLTKRQYRAYRRVLDGFHIPSLASVAEVRRLLEINAFGDVATVDVTAETRRTASHIAKASVLPLLLEKLHLDWLMHTSDSRVRQNRRGHYRAGMAYSLGLLQGYLRHGYYSGSRL